MFFFFCLLFITLSQSQTIKGKVVDRTTSPPLQFANVVLLQAADSSYVAGVTSGNTGEFTLEIPGEYRNYLLRVTFLGYESRLISLTQADLGEITLTEATNSLSEVTVTARAPQFRLEGSGLSTNIQNSRLKEIGTASDILDQLPLVTKTGNRYTVFGKGTPIIYINNRQVRDLSELEKIDSKDIKKVTVVTNPGSEYSANVKSVIKIETLRTTGAGLSGSAMARLTQGKTTRHNEWINLNYRIKNLDIFGRFSFSEDNGISDWKNLSGSNYNGTAFRVTENYRQNSYTRYITPNFGLNYNWGKGHTAGVKYERTQGKFDFDSDSELDVYSNSIRQDYIYSFREWNRKQNRDYLNAYYNGTVLPRVKIRLNVDYFSGDVKEYQDINNDGETQNQVITTVSTQDYELFAAKLTAITPLWNGELAYGSEYSYTKTTQNFEVESREPTYMEPDENLARQNAIAPFASYSKTFRSFSANIGLRYENVNFSYYVNDLKVEQQSRSYHHLFPSIDLTYSGTLQMMLGYRRVIARPSYWQLRNSIKYSSVYLYETGNPYLQPTLTDVFSLLLVWKDFQFSANYENSKDYVAFLSRQFDENPDIILTYFENLKHFRDLSVSAVYSTRIKAWQPSVEASVEKDMVKYEGERFNKPVYSLKIRNSVAFSKEWLLGADLRYTGSGHKYLAYNKENFRADIYLSKNFLNKRLRINLRGNDIFNTDRFKERTILNNTILDVKRNSHHRSVMLSVSYRFNPTTNKYKGEKASEEINRL